MHVRLFAGLREQAGTGNVEVDLADGATVGDVWARLGLGDEPAGLLYARNRAYVERSEALMAGDEVAVIPPVSGGDFKLSGDPLSVDDAVAEVRDERAGAIATFIGTTRAMSRGREVVRLEYEAFDAMTAAEMARIFERCRTHVATSPERTLRMLVHHRTGTVEVGEPSVVIAVASPHRDAAFTACRFLIDELKQSMPIWKKEIYADGEEWIGERS